MLNSKFETVDEIIIVRDFGHTQKNSFITGEIKQDVIGFSFYEQGEANIVSDTDKQIGTKSQMKWSLFFASKEIKYIHRELIRGSNLSQLTLLFPINYLKSRLPIHELEGSVMEKFIQPDSPYLDQKQEPINKELLSPVMKIIECKLLGEMRKLYLEAQCLEILSLLSFHKSNSQDEYKLDLKTIDKLQLAQEILIKNFKNPPTINALSKMVGLNTFALKKGFKSLFNYPIHTWINAYRMDYAREKLSSRNYSVNQVSEMLGYANANSFSYAFKAYFGHPPSRT